MSVFVGIPSYGNHIHEGMLGAFIHATEEKGTVGAVCTSSYSLLARNFNILLAKALNMREVGITHFLLWHADIIPVTSWFLDKMLHLMQKHDCDVLSAIVPVKDQTGLTSTALETEDKWTFQRLTLHETFDKRTSATFSDPNLVVNSGLMLIDITKPWIEQCWFAMEDEIYKEGTQFKVRGISEDWLFSRRAKALGAKLCATREIQVHHAGASKFPNTHAWGSKHTDD